MFAPFRKLAFCAGIVIAGTAIASADSGLSTVGSESRIVGALAGDQVNPGVAVNASGGFVVWQDNSLSPIGARIRLNRLDADFSGVGSPVIVTSAYKSKATGSQEKPKVALLPNGGAVVVWQQSGLGKAPAQQIYARFVNPDGTLIKSDIRVGAHPKNNQADPAVAVSSDGTVMVTWSCFGLDGSMDGVFGQRFSSTGAKQGKEFQVNTTVLNNQHQADIAALVDGTFVVTWISEFQTDPNSSIDVIARQFSSAGLPLGQEIIVSTSTSNACANASIVSLGTNGFAIAWSQKADAISFSEKAATPSQQLTSEGWDVYGRFYNAQGNPTPEAMRLNNTTYGDQFAPKLASCEQGCLAVWTSLGQDGSREGVFAQLLDNVGNARGSELQVNTTTASRQMQPVIVSNGVNRFLTVWTSVVGTPGVSGASSFDLFAQTYLCN